MRAAHTHTAPVALGPGQGKSIQLGPGEHLLFRATADTSCGQYSMFELTVQPMEGPPEHVHHEHDEAYYVLEGTFDLKAGEQRITATAGTFVLVPRGTPHAYQNLASRRSRMLVLSTPGGIESYFEALVPHMWGASDLTRLAPLVEQHDVEVVGPPLGRR